MSVTDELVKREAGRIFEEVRELFSLRHQEIIPCLAIALGMASGDMLFTNGDIVTEQEIDDEILRILREMRKISIEVLQERFGRGVGR